MTANFRDKYTMAYTISQINYETILPIWQHKLWPSRKSEIETHSAMLHLFTEYDIGNFNLPVWYSGCYIDGRLIGVNSGHMCTDGSSRSRGLWVDPLYRGNHYGKYLLDRTIEHAIQHDATSIWSMPRKSAWNTYKSAGFVLTADWAVSETSDANAYCYLDLKDRPCIPS